MNSEHLALELEMREEIREAAAIRVANQKVIVARHFNKHVKLRGFAKGDMVLCQTSEGKLDPGWEGPFIIDAELLKGA